MYVYFYIIIYIYTSIYTYIYIHIYISACITWRSQSSWKPSGTSQRIRCQRCYPCGLHGFISLYGFQISWTSHGRRSRMRRYVSAVQKREGYLAASHVGVSSRPSTRGLPTECFATSVRVAPQQLWSWFEPRNFWSHCFYDSKKLAYTPSGSTGSNLTRPHTGFALRRAADR